ncbi:hypothetical protein [Streptomyces sp. CB01881]|uniref:hypothetical protein n=1 Tax=Streptomyces sp. CB01881 TaxID=2078691 RepID=UPI000CDC9D53|nr:hypothetical protein [Streptomyces sp. CB01881]AUY51862.1 hypothetical protein C2142_26390 [Streptomyces sp. CB01881]TYC71290.1 hypothetical protein EH183_26370 [Streptomyces sp. CB01881]
MRRQPHSRPAPPERDVSHTSDPGGKHPGITRVDLLDPLLLLGADQQHIVTRAQLRRLGVPPGTIAHRLRPGGPWQRVLPRVICLQTGRLTSHQRRRAALAYAGPKGRAVQGGEVLLTGVAVLADAGLPSAGHPADLAEVDVLIPGQRRVADRGFVRVHRAAGAMPGGFERDDGLWSTTVSRALADLAPCETGRRRLRALCAEAVQRRHCAFGELLDQLLARPGTLELPHVAQVMEGLSAGVRSVVEGEARELVHGRACRNRSGIRCSSWTAASSPSRTPTGRTPASRWRSTPGPGT